MINRGRRAAWLAVAAACLCLAGCPKSPDDKLPECKDICAGAVLPYGKCLVQNAEDSKVPTKDAYATPACREKAKVCKQNPTMACQSEVATCVLEAAGGKPPIHPWACRKDYIKGAATICQCQVK